MQLLRSLHNSAATRFECHLPECADQPGQHLQLSASHDAITELHAAFSVHFAVATYPETSRLAIGFLQALGQLLQFFANRFVDSCRYPRRLALAFAMPFQPCFQLVELLAQFFLEILPDGILKPIGVLQMLELGPALVERLFVSRTLQCVDQIAGVVTELELQCFEDTFPEQSGSGRGAGFLELGMPAKSLQSLAFEHDLDYPSIE